MKQKIPTSPFATRLSSSAKETELRLRNIFQWKKKRPPVVLLILAALVALFCGGLVSCHPGGEEPPVDSDMMSDSPDKINTSMDQEAIRPSENFVRKLNGYMLHDAKNYEFSVELELTAVKTGEQAYLTLLEHDADLPHPEDGMEYVVIWLSIVYMDGESEFLYLREIGAALPEIRLTGENGDMAAEVACSQNYSGWSFDVLMEKGHFSEFSCVFLRKTGTCNILTFTGFGRSAQWDISSTAGISPYDKTGLDSITYVDFMPVSYIRNGVQLMTGDFGWYSQIVENLLNNAPAKENLELMDTKAIYTADSDQNENINYISSSGNWDMFPTKVTYRKYTLENQPEQEEWIEYFEEKLSEVGASDTPVVITEAWIFDWNGTETAAVNASNAIISDDETMETVYVDGTGGGHAEPNLPPRENTVMYMMSALFTQGNAPVDTISIDYQMVSKEPGGYLPPDHGSYQHIFSAVQYDEHGDLTVCPVFFDFMSELTTRQFKYSPESYLVCDIDGNGEVELIGHVERNSSISCLYKVYKLEDRVPTCTFSIVAN